MIHRGHLAGRSCIAKVGQPGLGPKVLPTKVQALSAVMVVAMADASIGQYQPCPVDICQQLFDVCCLQAQSFLGLKQGDDRNDAVQA